MKSKEQAFKQIERIIAWNTLRGNTPETLDYQLEIDMLQEELDEFKEAVDNKDIVAMFDALLDLDFVRVGTLSKLGIVADMQVAGLEVVIEANEQKTANKNDNGKITKPEDFANPEPKLMELLNER